MAPINTGSPGHVGIAQPTPGRFFAERVCNPAYTRTLLAPESGSPAFTKHAPSHEILAGMLGRRSGTAGAPATGNDQAHFQVQPSCFPQGEGKAIDLRSHKPVVLQGGNARSLLFQRATVLVAPCPQPSQLFRVSWILSQVVLLVWVAFQVEQLLIKRLDLWIPDVFPVFRAHTFTFDDRTPGRSGIVDVLIVPVFAPRNILTVEQRR